MPVGNIMTAWHTISQACSHTHFIQPCIQHKTSVTLSKKFYTCIWERNYTCAHYAHMRLNTMLLPHTFLSKSVDMPCNNSDKYQTNPRKKRTRTSKYKEEIQEFLKKHRRQDLYVIDAQVI